MAGSDRKSRVEKVLVVLILTLVISIVISLFLIPTIFYAILTARDTATISSQTNCSETVIYAGMVCRNELESSQACFTGNTARSPIMIPAAIDQRQAEADVSRLLAWFERIGSAIECTEEVKNFLCLHTLGLCINDELRSIDAETCMLIRDTLCPNEWMLANQLIEQENLLECEDLPSERVQCTGSISVANLSIDVEFNDTEMCDDEFFFDEEGTQTCRPICGKFLARDVLHRRILISVGFVLSLVLLLVVVPLQRTKMLTFPIILLLYICISVTTQTAFIVIGFFDNTKLYCSSRDLTEATAIGNETAFCTVTGLVTSYCVIQQPFLALANAAITFWALAFPFHYRRVKISGRKCHIHIAIVITALLLPLPFALAHLKHGFVGEEYPIPLCLGRNSDFNYYFFILPQSMMICATTVLLVLVASILFKACMLRRIPELLLTAKAELSIFVILIYLIISVVIGLVGSTYIMRNRDKLEEEINTFLICSLQGGLFVDCRQFLSDTLNVIYSLTDTSLIMLAFLPSVVLIISINFKTCRKKSRSITISSKATPSPARSMHNNTTASCVTSTL